MALTFTSWYSCNDLLNPSLEWTTTASLLGKLPLRYCEAIRQALVERYLGAQVPLPAALTETVKETMLPQQTLINLWTALEAIYPYYLNHPLYSLPLVAQPDLVYWTEATLKTACGFSAWPSVSPWTIPSQRTLVWQCREVLRCLKWTVTAGGYVDMESWYEASQSKVQLTHDWKTQAPDDDWLPQADFSGYQPWPLFAYPNCYYFESEVYGPSNYSAVRTRAFPQLPKPGHAIANDVTVYAELNMANLIYGLETFDRNDDWPSAAKKGGYSWIATPGLLSSNTVWTGTSKVGDRLESPPNIPNFHPTGPSERGWWSWRCVAVRRFDVSDGFTFQ